MESSILNISKMLNIFALVGVGEEIAYKCGCGRVWVKRLFTDADVDRFGSAILL